MSKILDFFRKKENTEEKATTESSFVFDDVIKKNMENKEKAEKERLEKNKSLIKNLNFKR